MMLRATSPRRLPRSTLRGPLDVFRQRIRDKIVVPYLILLAALALALIAINVNLLATSLEDKFRDELADAGLAANEAMVKVEERHLTILRSMVFTAGVDEAVAAHDDGMLASLLSPVMV